MSLQALGNIEVAADPEQVVLVGCTYCFALGQRKWDSHKQDHLDRADQGGPALAEWVRTEVGAAVGFVDMEPVGLGMQEQRLVVGSRIAGLEVQAQILVV